MKTTAPVSEPTGVAAYSKAGTLQLGHLLRHGAALVPVCEVADHVQSDVGPVEAVHQHQRVLHAQALLDFVAHRGERRWR